MNSRDLNEELVVDGEYLLEKFSGKGGWTYVSLPEIKPDRSVPFGWVKVRGSIDDYELKHYKLMPKGNGEMFLPVRSEIREKIRKEAGDHVSVRLFLDRSDYVVPKEVLDCFENEPKALLNTFLAFSDSEKKAYIDWVLSANTDETKVKRISQMMSRLERGLKFYDT